MDKYPYADKLVVLDSITHLTPDAAGQVVIAASHGGTYAAWCAARGGVRAVVLNDAGVGWQAAGVAGLSALQGWGIAAAAADYRSCRIGDGIDMARHGVLTCVNAPAHALGCCAGMTVRQAVPHLQQAHATSILPPPMQEARQLLRTPAGNDGASQVIGVDSVSLVTAQDDGCIVVTGSHGECLAGAGDDGVCATPRLVTFNDAGPGKDGAGTGRLPHLQRRGVAALTVSAQSACIGDARSCYETGVISCVNTQAQQLGARNGMLLHVFIACLLS